MKSIQKVKKEYGGIDLVESVKPKIEHPSDVLIKVCSSAICGSDVHTYEWIESSQSNKVPVIMGHEFSGVVEEVGQKVINFEIGDRVMGESNAYCGVCENCKAGKTNVCNNSKMRGLTSDGAMAEYVVMDEKYIHKLPSNLDYSSAAVAQPCSVVIHGVFDNCQILPGDIVVVFGPGIMGIIAAQLAKARGAHEVFVVGTEVDRKTRQPMVEKLGFIFINGQSQNIEEVIEEKTGKKNVDVCIECSGSQIALKQASSIIKKNGYLLILGIYPKDVTFNLTSLVRKEVKLRTSYTSTGVHYDLALKLLNQKILDLTQLYTEYTVNDYQNAFIDAVNKDVLKPVFVFERG